MTKDRRAFTLVELLVTTGMLAIVATAAFAVFSAGIRSSEKTRRSGAMVGRAQIALQAMAEDIRSALEHGDSRLTSLDAQHEGMDCDTIDFVITRPNPDREEPDAGARAEVGYSIDNNPDTEARWLLRREDATLDDDVLEGGVASLAGPFVSELNLEFYDGEKWKAGWDDQEAFPLAVRIQIVVLDDDETERPRQFSTTVPIMAR